MIKINQSTVINRRHLVFRYSRSSGPGGQNVNKLNTRVTLFFDVPGCPDLSREQKERIIKKLGARADKTGVVRVVCQKYRTQNANRRAAVEKFTELIKNALKTKAYRIKTTVPKSADEKRLAEKKRKSEIKKFRRKPDIDT
jgi:ribosome-associated protein